jgi:8-oxo-dGTP pyrophosphatase MutT (NUDIX family)
MAKKQEVEIMARAACVVDGYLLVCHTKGAKVVYLPGGHIDFGESARTCVVRELREELGVAAAVHRFLGVAEHTFVQKGDPKCEVNLVFEVTVPDLTPERHPPSAEDYIEFFWVPLAGLAHSVLEPAPLRRSLRRWLAAAGEAPFVSTFDVSTGPTQ